MKQTLWFLYIGIMFACVEVMAALFWYIHLSKERSLVVTEPNNWIFFVELGLLTLAAVGTLIFTILWTLGRVRIEMHGKVEESPGRLGDVNIVQYNENMESLKELKNKLK